MSKLYIGIDNGVTGTIGAICDDKTWFFETPTKFEQDYTKAKKNITRVNINELFQKLSHIINESQPDAIMCLIERPMVNPKRWNATESALRCHEVVLSLIEFLEIPFQFEDSKKWQKELLPIGSKGDQLKEDSKQIGIRLFPQHREIIEKHKDADGVLLAEYCRRKF